MSRSRRKGEYENQYTHSQTTRELIANPEIFIPWIQRIKVQTMKEVLTTPGSRATAMRNPTRKPHETAIRLIHKTTTFEVMEKGSVNHIKQTKSCMSCIRPQAACNDITVTFGKKQILYNQSLRATETIIHISTWLEYTIKQATKGKRNEKFENYRIQSRKQRVEQLKPFTAAGKEVWCHGPYDTEITIDGVKIKTPIYVTEDEDFEHDLLIGDDVWQAKKVNIKKVKRITGIEEDLDKKDETKISNDAQAKIKIQGQEYAALVDTGAAPSLMTIEQFYRIGGQKEEILPSKTKLLAANDTEIVAIGQTMPLEFSINDTTYEWAFLLVESLGSDSMLLGRDFLRHYSITINLKTGTMYSENKKPESTLRNSYRMDEQRQQYIVTSNQVLTIEPGAMKKVDLIINKRVGKNQIDTSNESPTLVYVRGKEMVAGHEGGLCFGHCITKMQGDKISIPVMNVDIKNTQSISTKDIRLIIHKVYIDYERDSNNNSMEQEIDRISMLHDEWEGTEQTQYVNKIKKDKDNLIGSETDEGSDTLHSMTAMPVDLRSSISITEQEREFPTKPDLSKIRPELTDAQNDELNQIMTDYADLFSKHAGDIGHTHLIPSLSMILPRNLILFCII